MSTDLHTLSGAYALDALSTEDAAEFHTHLAGCPACMLEVRELREAASRMGAAEAARPPAGLKARIMAAVDQEAQLPPLVMPTPITRRSHRQRPRRWTPRLLTAAAAVVLIVAGAIGLGQIQQDQTPSVAAVFAAPDAHQATIDTSNGGKIRIATSTKLDKMAVDTGGLAKLGEKQVYQLWAITAGVPTSVGVLDDLDAGAAMDLPGSKTKVAITIEPAGGSKQPTTDPIVALTPGQV